MTSGLKGLHSKCFKGNDLCPKLDDDKLTMFIMRFCPYAQRGVLVAIAKGIEMNIVNTALYPEHRPSFLVEKSNGKVPVLQKGDLIISESLIVCDYLDEKFPGTKLHPDCLEQKALDRMCVEKNDKSAVAFWGFSRDYENTKKIAVFHDNLDLMEKDLADRRGKNGGLPFFGGKSPKMVDYMIWPFYERYLALPIYAPMAVVKKERFPELVKWMELMKSDPVASAYLWSPEDHAGYIASYIPGPPNFDYKLE